MTDPDWLTLADRLDVMSRNGYNPDAHDDLRAAADGLRQYAAITAAIGDPDQGANTAAAFRRRVLAAAAAVSSGTPTPTTCPTCGSTNRDRVKPNDCEIIPDAWHDSGQP